MLRCSEQAGLPRREREALRCCERAATRARGAPAGGTRKTCIEHVWYVDRVANTGNWRVGAQKLVTCSLQGDTGRWR